MSRVEADPNTRPDHKQPNVVVEGIKSRGISGARPGVRRVSFQEE